VDHPLRSICSGWLEKIRLAYDYKKKKFQDSANDVMSFYNGPADATFDKKYATESRGMVLSSDQNIDPTFKMNVNKVAEMVEIMGPALYHRNPIRQVNPRKVPLPPFELLGDPTNPQAAMTAQAWLQQINLTRAADKGRASLLEFYLNATPELLDLKTDSRLAIDEALIKGMGCLWTELYQPYGSSIKLVSSFYDSVDNILIDPDMETLRDAKWIARRCVHPAWQIEEEYGLEKGSLKGKYESYNQQSSVNVDPDGDYNRVRGLTNDLIVYYKVFSKMGMGGRMKGSANEAAREVLEQFGDFVYLVILEGTPYPLNLPPTVINDEDPNAGQAIMQRLQWPTPFWADDSWPFTPIKFHDVPRCVWPMSHVMPGIGELKFLNWAYSFLAGKIRTTCRDFIAIKKSVGEEMKTAILSGEDLTLVEIEALHGTISDCVQFLQHPAMNQDIFKVLEAIEHNFERRVGLNEYSYGETVTQSRSAADASTKSDQTRIRPDDMAKKVEEAMTEVSRHEAIAARWHLADTDVAPIMGPIGAQWWSKLVMTSDLLEVTHQLDYRIEAGSTRKPNRDRDQQNMQQAITTLLPIFMNFGMATGNLGAANKLIQDWGKTLDLDTQGYEMQAPPPPPPGASGPGGPPPGPGGPPQQQQGPPQQGPPGQSGPKRGGGRTVTTTVQRDQQGRVSGTTKRRG
jgi:hypothetical protein